MLIESTSPTTKKALSKKEGEKLDYEAQGSSGIH